MDLKWFEHRAESERDARVVQEEQSLEAMVDADHRRQARRGWTVLALTVVLLAGFVVGMFYVTNRIQSFAKHTLGGEPDATP